MAENTPQKQDFKLFREKSLEAVESPESLNDYLRVTSPGVWLVLASVVALLAGVLIWGIFGRIETRLGVAVSSSDGVSVCYMPYRSLQDAISAGEVSIDGAVYALSPEKGISIEALSKDEDPYLLIALDAVGLGAGDTVALVPLSAGLPEGVYKGSILTESLQPISLLLK